MKVGGSIGKFGYSHIPDDIKLDVVNIGVNTAYRIAVLNAPYDPTPDGIHIKEDLKFKLATNADPIGEVWIKSPYAAAAEYGSRRRFAHPYFSKGRKAAWQKIRAILRKAVKEAIAKEKPIGDN
jgi:hypothetical protein